jgi:hypothetical protein
VRRLGKPFRAGISTGQGWDRDPNRESWEGLWGIPSRELVPTVFHVLTSGRVTRRVRVLLTHGSCDRVWSRDCVVFDTTRDTSRDGVGTWSRAWTRDRLGARVSHDIDFPGSRGRGCAFSTWL